MLLIVVRDRSPGLPLSHRAVSHSERYLSEGGWTQQHCCLIACRGHCSSAWLDIVSGGSSSGTLGSYRWTIHNTHTVYATVDFTHTYLIAVFTSCLLLVVISTGQHWRTDCISETNYDAETRSISFQMNAFYAFTLLQESYANMPFQSWELRPLGQDSALFTITGALTEVSITVKARKALFKDI